MNHILPSHKKGDTFPGELFHMQEIISGEPFPIDLTGVQICMDVRVSAAAALTLRLTNYEVAPPPIPGVVYGTVSLVTPLDGYWRIDPQVIDIKAAGYVYDIQFTFPTNPPKIETLIEGSWAILQDITHD